MCDLLEQVRQTIATHTLLSQNDTVLVALSGGADSVALLKALSLLKEEYNLTLIAAHVHHGIRGEEADTDCALAQSLCQSLSIPCLVQYANVPALCAQTGEGEEECGRRIRYEFFHSVEGITKIATAHTLNDHAETLLLHLARGSGLQGLRGILPKRGKVIRPLLDCSRTQVEAFCQAHQLPFAVDSSNANTKYRRNYVRHKILPLFEQLNPLYLESLGRCANANQKDFDYLQGVGQQLLHKVKNEKGYLVAPLLEAHPVERHYALQALFTKEGVPSLAAARYEEVDALLQKGEGKCSLGGTFFACVFQGLFTIEQPLAPAPPPLPVTLCQTTYEYFDKQVEFSPSTCEKVCNLLTYNGIDGDKIGTGLYLRTRLPGDAITLPKRGCTKSLKKLFNEQKMPHDDRATCLVLCDQQGIVWVEGVGCDARCAPTQDTANLWMITIH